VDTQNCVGTALTALGAAVSMILDPPTEGVDEQVLTDFLSQAGQILTGVFYQQSVARKSFITPQLSKDVKPTVEAINSDEWLYGNDFKEKVKDAKAIGKVCADIKEKPQSKILKSRLMGNSRYPPVQYRQVGYQPRRHIQFRRKPFQNLSRKTPKGINQTTNQSSAKKQSRYVNLLEGCAILYTDGKISHRISIF